VVVVDVDVPAVKQAPFRKVHEFVVAVPVKFSVKFVCAVAASGVKPAHAITAARNAFFKFMSDLLKLKKGWVFIGN
jgi:hypothetical protein